MNSKKRLCSIVAVFITVFTMAQDQIQLIIRGDDMGFSHATNMACIEAYNTGILTTAEVMAPTPWFLDAANLLNRYPDLDVGKHLTLNSEWNNYNWAPLSGENELTDASGYFPLNTADFLALGASSEAIESGPAPYHRCREEKRLPSRLLRGCRFFLYQRAFAICGKGQPDPARQPGGCPRPNSTTVDR